MVKFGKFFRANQLQEFEGNYLNYKLLKHFIKEKINSVDNTTIKDINFQDEFDSILEEFSVKLNKECKFFLFFLKKERTLYEQINQHLHIKNIYEKMNDKLIAKEYLELSDIAQTALKLINFITINVLALKKILKKFDKKFKKEFTKYYISLKTDPKNGCDLLYIFGFEKIDEILTLIIVLEEELSKSEKRKKNKQTNSTPENFERSIEDYNQNSGSREDESFIIEEIQIPGVINREKEKIPKFVNEINHIINQFKAQFTNWISYLKDYKDIMSIKSIVNERIKANQSKDSIRKDKDNFLPSRESISEMMNKSQKRAKFPLGKTNRINISLIFFHMFSSGLAYYIIFPNFVIGYSSLKNNSNDNNIQLYELLYIPIYIMVPLGTLLGLYLSKKPLCKTIKMKFIVISFFSSIGNFLYSLAEFMDKNQKYQKLKYIIIFIMIIGRMCLGLGLNKILCKDYLINNLPKRLIGKYIFKCKIISLIAYVLGTLLCSISSLLPNNIKYIKTSFPSFICSFLSLIEIVFISFLFTDPTKNEFEPLLGNAFDSLMGKQDSKEIRVHEIKYNGRLSDGELITSTINNIVWKEKNTNNVLKKSFLIMQILVFLSSFLVTLNIFYLVLFREEKALKLNREGDGFLYSSIVLFVSFTIELIFYYLYIKKLRRKLKDNIMIICLLLGISILQLLTICCFETIKYQKFLFIEGNVINLLFIILIGILFFLSYFLATFTMHLCSKLIPYDNQLSTENKVTILFFAGQISGCVFIVLFKTFCGSALIIVPLGIIAIFFYCICNYKVLKETALTRVLKGKAQRKFIIWEF